MTIREKKEQKTIKAFSVVERAKETKMTKKKSDRGQARERERQGKKRYCQKTRGGENKKPKKKKNTMRERETSMMI